MPSDEAATGAYYESLPGKRIGAGALVRDGSGRVRLVKPTYKPMWEVPGGVVEAGESPMAAAAREVTEELGVGVSIGRLLVVDWLPVREPKTEGLMMLFDGGRLTDELAAHIVLPPEELSEWRFFEPAGLTEVLPEHMARRVAIALELVDSDRSAYLEHGRIV